MTDTLKENRSRKVIFLLFLGAALLSAGFIIFKPQLRMGGAESKDRVPVFGGWAYGDADQKKAIAALAKANLSDYEWKERKLWVPASERSGYERVLGEAQAFPEAPSDIKREALSEMGAFEPESRTKLRDLYSNGWQLERTLEKFEQVETASVGVNCRKEQSGLHQRNVVTATIWISPQKDRYLTPELISAITMAARHHLGITENQNISIIDLRQGRSYHGTEGAVSNMTAVSYAQEQLRQENLWREKFLNAFGHIPGIRIATSIDLVPITAEKMASVSSSEKADMEESAEADEGAADNKKNRVGGLLFAGDDDPFAETTFAPESGGSSESLPQFKPRAVAVSISIPESFIRKLCGSERFKSEEAAELPSLAETAAASEIPENPETAETVANESGDAPNVESASTDELFQNKSEEVIHYVQEMATTLLTPLVESNEISKNASLVEVSLYSDTEGNQETLLHPEILAESSADEDLEENSEKTAVEKTLAFYKDHSQEVHWGAIILFIAFGTGALSHSLVRRRKPKDSSDAALSAKRKNVSQSGGVTAQKSETNRSVLGNASEKFSETSEEKSYALPTEKIQDDFDIHFSGAESRPERSFEHSSGRDSDSERGPEGDLPSHSADSAFSELKKSEQEKRLEQLFDDIPETEEDFDEILNRYAAKRQEKNDAEGEDEEESILPASGARGNFAEDFAEGDSSDSDASELISFDPQGGEERSYRIESEEKESARPHFPLSAIQGRRSEEGTRSRYSFRNLPTPIPAPKRASVPFSFLRNQTPEALRTVLSRQRPQTIAMIVRVLTEKDRAVILNALGKRLREEIERRAAETEYPDEKVLAAVETSIQREISELNLSQNTH